MAEERTMEIEYVPREIFELKRINDRTEIERKIDKLDLKIDVRAAEINGRIDSLDAKLDATKAELSGRIDSLDAKLDATKAELSSKDDILAEKIDSNEAKLTGKIDEVQTVLSIAINATNSRLDNLERSLERMDRTYTFLLSFFGLILVVCTFIAPIAAPLIQKFFQ